MRDPPKPGPDSSTKLLAELAVSSVLGPSAIPPKTDHETQGEVPAQTDGRRLTAKAG
jgi:hypothetical protein